MPARKKRSESALKRWAKDKQNCSPKSTNRPAKRKQWSDESMLQAIEAVRLGMMGTNQAARAHGVPPTTLKDRLAGRVKHGAPYLTAEEENELVKSSEKDNMGRPRGKLYPLYRGP